MEVFGCCGALFGLFVVLLIGSGLLRASVAAANRVLGPIPPPDTFGQWDDWDDEDEPRAAKRRRRLRPEQKVPEPGLATGGLVTFLSALIAAGGYGGCAVVAGAMLDELDRPGEWTPFVVLVVSVPLTFVVHALMLNVVLATTFRRAALVSLFNHLIVLAIAAVAAGAVYLVLGK